MAKLNDKNDITKKKIHIMITERCDRKCPYCCNNQYNIEDIERVTKYELAEAEEIFLTGGEPFAYADPCNIAYTLKKDFPNIKKVYVYTNALELRNYLTYFTLNNIDGLTISIKNKLDQHYFENKIAYDEEVLKLKSNWVYVFPGFEDTRVPSGFNKIVRKWQKDFTPAPDSIFRRL